MSQKDKKITDKKNTTSPPDPPKSRKFSECKKPEKNEPK